MVSRVNCVAISGIETRPVLVETDVSNGLPAFDMVGLLSSDIKEARERVRTAIKNAGFVIPPKRITINLSPGDIRKAGTYFDLPIAVSILNSLGIINRTLDNILFVGELSLSGEIVSIKGVLPIVLCALKQGLELCVVPYDNVAECNFINGIKVVGVKDLNQLIYLLGNDCATTISSEIINDVEDETPYDFSYIKGQVMAKKAAEIAAAGMHNLLMIGPPGTGKTMIAKAMPSIMPDMDKEEQIEISIIQSIAGYLHNGLVGRRPFRNPHHTTTVAAMTGGGINPKPGEITLAHGGCLFLDEFPEFSKGVIETLRQPMEEGNIKISRVGGIYEFPARFVLLASMNPCKCGYFPDRDKCSCTLQDVKRYLEKISGPIMDRIDMSVEMNRISFEDARDKNIESSDQIRERVYKAVSIQRERYKKEKIIFNSQLSGNLIDKYCALGSGEQKLAHNIFKQLQLSMRGYEKLLKVARTIADLEGEEHINCDHISQAVGFRIQI